MKPQVTLLATLGLLVSVSAARPAWAQIENPQQFRALDQASFNRRNGEVLLQEANAAISRQDFTTAAELLNQAFEAFNERSNFHQQLASAFSGIDNRITDEQREFARAAAQTRDEVSYELGIVFRAANRPEDAVASFVQVVNSQSPTRELGQRAYQQLLELGFVSTPYPN